MIKIREVGVRHRHCEGHGAMIAESPSLPQDKGFKLPPAPRLWLYRTVRGRGRVTVLARYKL
eukprot:636869-Hanusia_phi.AAC.1